MALTAQIRLFCHEYLVDLNGKAAAIRAGYSPKSAETRAAKLRMRQDVRDYIQALMDKRASKIDLTAERVLEEIARVAFVDVSELFDETGNLRSINDLPKDVARAIAAVDTSRIRRKDGDDEETETVKKVKIFDKLKALELAGRHLKLFRNDDDDVKGITVIVKNYSHQKDADDGSDGA